MVCAALLLHSCGHCDASIYHGVCLPTDTLVLEPIDTVTVLPSDTKVALQVEVVTSSGVTVLYTLDVPEGSTLLEALEILKGSSVGFTYVHLMQHFFFFLTFSCVITYTE